MRYFAAIVIFCLGMSSVMLAQEQKLNMPIDPDNHTITYQEVVEVEGTQDELFNRGSTWLHVFYKNPMAVSKVRDQASGVIRGQHEIRVYFTGENGSMIDAGTVLYDFKLEFKDGRYRYTVDDFVVKKISRYPVENWLNKQDPEYSPNWDEYLKQLDNFIRKEWVPSLKENMRPEMKEEKDDNW